MLISSNRISRIWMWSLEILLFGSFLSALTACAQNLGSKAPRYQIYEMRSAMVRPVRPNGDHNIAWIDEDRVLFEGWDRNLKDTEPRAGPASDAWRGLYIWNIRTAEVTRYTTEPLRGSMCFADGYVTYVVSRAKQQVRLEGPLGHEKALVPIGNEVRDRLVNRFTCRSYEKSSLPKLVVGGGIEPLRPDHGWIEQTGSATWFRSAGGLLTLLTHEGRSMGPVRPRKYSSVSGKYVFWRPSDNKTWLIRGDGSTELLPHPLGPIHKGSLEPMSSDALLLRSTEINTRANWDPGLSGLYMYQPSTEPKRLIPGLMHAVQVQSKGCLAAVIVDPWNRKGREYELKAVDVCRERGHVDK